MVSNDTNGILIHIYADDTQLYIKLSAKDIVNAKSRLLACFSDIQACVHLCV